MFCNRHAAVDRAAPGEDLEKRARFG